jgi:bifunctional UDP-N-acetylglucosamine pyrophosphorylase/glucosamine-1-phosphate N-acetyltransferase
MYGPETIYIEQGIPVGADTVIHPGVNITGKSEIGVGCIIEPGVFLHDCTINNNTIIGAWSTLHKWVTQPSEYIFPRTIRVEKDPVPHQPSGCR